jgi:flagellar basal-body rod protein FlgG
MFRWPAALGLILCATPLAGAQAPTYEGTEEITIEIRVRVPRRGHEQGLLVHTGAPFDVAIEGPGFFRVMLSDGEVRYTRDGAFRLNEKGQIVTARGHEVSPLISVPADAVAVSIAPDGTVSVVRPWGPRAPVIVGQLPLWRFDYPVGLGEEIGLFRATVASGESTQGAPGESGLGVLRQGFRERAGKSGALELLELIDRLAEEQGAAVRFVK